MKKRREKAVLVDRISRWLFPTSFILLNIVYWALFGDHDLWWAQENSWQDVKHEINKLLKKYTQVRVTKMLIKDGVDGIDSGIWTRRILNEFWTLTSKADNSKSNACWNLTSSPPCTWTNIFLKAEWSYLQWKLTYICNIHWK